MSKSGARHASHGRPPAGEGGDRRELILDSALNLFAGHGIAGTTIARIAEEANVTPAMVHYYFANRAGVLDAIVAERLAPIVDYIWSIVSGEDRVDPRQVIVEFVDRILETVERMPQLPLLWSREMLNAGGLLRERVMALIPVERFALLTRIFSDAQKRGEFNPAVDPALILISIMGLVFFPLIARDMIGTVGVVSSLDRSALRKHALSVLMNGLCGNSHLEERS